MRWYIELSVYFGITHIIWNLRSIFDNVFDTEFFSVFSESEKLDTTKHMQAKQIVAKPTRSGEATRILDASKFIPG